MTARATVGMNWGVIEPPTDNQTFRARADGVNNGTIAGTEAMSTSDKVKKIIADQALVPVEDITDSAAPEDLGLDSLALVEIVFAIEEEFDVSVPFNANDPDHSDFDISSVAKIVEAVDNLIKAKA